LVNVETTALELVSVAPPPKRELLPSKAGFVKIRLSFLTNDPKHVRSQMLRLSCNSKPPFVEDICILLPLGKTFSILETFIPAFEKLQEDSTVSDTAKLLTFKILDDDTCTLAFLFE